MAVLKIGYIIADFPVLSETFVVNDIRGLVARGHDEGVRDGDLGRETTARGDLGRSPAGGNRQERRHDYSHRPRPSRRPKPRPARA